jgi:hypothetical protein
MSTQIGQKQSVINAVSEVLGSSFVPSSTIVRDVITSEQLESVRQLVFAGIISGSVAFGKSTEDEKLVRRYVNGMVDNHFRKSPELNGGTKYTTPTPGSRGSRDSQLSTLRKLLKTFDEGSSQYTQVLNAIATREATLSSERASARASKRAASKSDSIDMSVLPPELQDIFSSSASA